MLYISSMGFIYLLNMEKTSLYKIGITSKSVEKRAKKLQTGNPLKIKIENTYESDFYRQIESTMHKMLKHKKYVEEDFDYIKGEWFILDNDDVRGFVEKCRKIEENLKFLDKNKI